MGDILQKMAPILWIVVPRNSIVSLCQFSECSGGFFAGSGFVGFLKSCDQITKQTLLIKNISSANHMNPGAQSK